MSDPDPATPQTVSQALAAHAAAQIAAARRNDQANRHSTPQTAKPVGDSFAVSWASASRCIGFDTPAAD